MIGLLLCSTWNKLQLQAEALIDQILLMCVDLIAQPLDRPGLFQLRVSSIHGVLWIQTHFPPEEWDTLFGDQACFGCDCIVDLLTDAKQSGLRVFDPVVVES